MPRHPTANSPPGTRCCSPPQTPQPAIPIGTRRHLNRRQRSGTLRRAPAQYGTNPRRRLQTPPSGSTTCATPRVSPPPRPLIARPNAPGCHRRVSATNTPEDPAARPPGEATAQPSSCRYCLGPTSSTKFPSGSFTTVKKIPSGNPFGNATGPFATGLTPAFSKRAIALLVSFTKTVM